MKRALLASIGLNAAFLMAPIGHAHAKTTLVTFKDGLRMVIDSRCIDEKTHAYMENRGADDLDCANQTCTTDSECMEMMGGDGSPERVK